MRGELTLLRDRFHCVLESAHTLRDKRPEPPAPNNYLDFEIGEMFVVVNYERRRRGKVLIDREFIVQAERKAQGHADYLERFCLYCAELVLESTMVLAGAYRDRRRIARIALES